MPVSSVKNPTVLVAHEQEASEQTGFKAHSFPTKGGSAVIPGKAQRKPLGPWTDSSGSSVDKQLAQKIEMLTKETAHMKRGTVVPISNSILGGNYVLWCNSIGSVEVTTAAEQKRGGGSGLVIRPSGALFFNKVRLPVLNAKSESKYIACDELAQAALDQLAKLRAT
jgi:hypothetical protein